MKRHASTTAELVSFSAGAIVGAGLALLYAPKPGHEVRERVSDATDGAITKMKDLTADVQQKVNSKLQRGRQYAETKAAEFAETAEETRGQLH
ncbi:hypothetical protein GMST_05810 [Geomonas silvestris]|uniref:General stress protein n=1 Tax=Geomonas silvestris TaxID=2740184 RepID=A0A6V8ME38_9BACT|nr:YtxH domain-containing protein [Geomonas silvestris]GFO58256.1 hypothetical protein GMST_05810 [Geomonas silvestris]